MSRNDLRTIAPEIAAYAGDAIDRSIPRQGR